MPHTREANENYVTPTYDLVLRRKSLESILSGTMENSPLAASACTSWRKAAQALWNEIKRAAARGIAACAIRTTRRPLPGISGPGEALLTSGRRVIGRRARADPANESRWRGF